MMQTVAIFLDAYRELNARKLFWITLILSGVVVVSFALIGINEQGLRLIMWDVPVPFLNTTVMSEETFYKTLFVELGIGFWLAWLATILALISTASIFPEFISSGSIDLVLSKPIGRLRLFLTKYATGLLFVGLQVAIFSVASFLVLGLKGGAWEPGILLAVPLVVVFFSYLFSICVLLGLATRSTIAALLLTLLIWFLIFSVHATESGILAFKLLTEQKVTALESRISSYEGTLQGLGKDANEPSQRRAASIRHRLEDRRSEVTDTKATLRKIEIAHRAALGVKTVLPKTTETIALLERWLIDLAELPAPANNDDSTIERLAESGAFTPDPEQLQLDAVEAIRGRSVGWVLGTSLAFEAGLLALAGGLFCRRDY
ncbi:MAG: ABC transporter permease [Planctomycetes bacterium]|nr:ABC transporter permease [Planctomycetota bacterium]